MPNDNDYRSRAAELQANGSTLSQIAEQLNVEGYKTATGRAFTVFTARAATQANGAKGRRSTNILKGRTKMRTVNNAPEAQFNNNSNDNFTVSILARQDWNDTKKLRMLYAYFDLEQNNG